MRQRLSLRIAALLALSGALAAEPRVVPHGRLEVLNASWPEARPWRSSSPTTSLPS